MDSIELGRIVANLRNLGSDTQGVEVKSSGKQLPKSVAESICAFANDGGGLLILGLEEQSGFTPTPKFEAKRIADALATLCERGFDRPLRPSIDQVSFEGATVVVAEIAGLPPKEKPCYLRSSGGVYGNAYIRTADGDHRLTPYEIDLLRSNHGRPTFDLEPVTQASLEDLNPELLRKYLDRERDLHPRIFGQDTEKDLRRLQVIASGEICAKAGKLVPTLAGLLALGTYPQEFFPQLTLTCTAYPGTDKGSLGGQMRFLDNVSLAGPIPYLVEDAVAFVRKNMRTGAVILGAIRYDLPDYPLEAVREAVTNALMHRDYSPGARGAQVQLNLYVDRLEVQSPGGLFGSVTLDKLGEDGVSDSRNSRLVKILESTPYRQEGMVAENRGSGYASMIKELETAHMPRPTAVDKIRYFRLTFFRRYLTDTERGAAAGRSTREAILEHLTAVESASSRDLAAAAGVALGSVRRVLAEMVDAKEIERTAPLSSPKQRYSLPRQN